MPLQEQLTSGKWITVVELQPPKGVDLSELHQHADQWKGRVDAISVPDLQNAIMRVGSLAVSSLLKAGGIEPIFTLSCANRNRLTLQSELLGASAMGLKNLLILPGDPPSMGDHLEAQPVSDLDVMGLLGAAKRLQEGYDLAGNELHGKPEFFVGASACLTAKGDALDRELVEMEKKIGVGVQFFVTSSVYDVDLFANFVKKASRFRVPILAGVTLLKSVGMARYIN